MYIYSVGLLLISRSGFTRTYYLKISLQYLRFLNVIIKRISFGVLEGKNYYSYEKFIVFIGDVDFFGRL